MFENGSEEWCTCERPADDAGFPLDQLVLAAGPNDETLASSERRATLAVYCHDGGTEYRAECDVIQPSFSPEIQIVLTDGTAKDKVEIEVPQEGETYTFEIRSNFKLVEILSECEWALCKLESVSEDSERKEYVYSAAVNVEKSQQPSERTSEIVLGNILTIDGKEVTASVTLAFMQEAANGIRYTTTDGQKITISENGMNVVSHVYEDGYGFIELGEILTEIPNGKFNGCSTLKTIELPYSVTTIGNSAFADCSSLESIELPENLTTLGTSVFYDCIALKSIEIPAGVRSLPSETFYNCTALENALLPDGMTEIGESAFRGSSSLKSIEIPDGIRSLPRCTFYQCTALENVVLPDGMTKIWESVFFDCSSLKSIEIPDGVVNLPYCTFYGCSSLEKVLLPDNMTEIGYSAFAGCSSLKEISLPKALTTFGGNYVFQNTGLVSIEIPEGVKIIPRYCFYNCTSLENIELSSIERIQYDGFNGCTSLESITIPGTVTSIGIAAFQNCSELYHVTCLAVEPPSLGYDAFLNANFRLQIFVPNIAWHAYKNSNWDDYSLIPL